MLARLSSVGTHTRVSVVGVKIYMEYKVKASSTDVYDMVLHACRIPSLYISRHKFQESNFLRKIGSHVVLENDEYI